MKDMTTEEEISKNLDDRNEARRDLRDTLTEVSAKAEQQEEEPRPDRLIESHPIAASCLAGGLGFLIGSRTRPSAVGPAMIVALLGYAIFRRFSVDGSRGDVRETFANQ